MIKKIVIDAKYPNEIRAALINKQNIIEEIECETADKEQIKGNIYLAKVSRIEPSLQAAFITYENGKSGFLPFNEIHPDFFNISDTKPESNNKEILASNNNQTIINTLDIVDQNFIQELDDNQNKDNDKNLIKIDFDASCEEDEIDVIKVQYENLYKKYKIQDVVKKGQTLLVQAQKEKRGNKAASFSTFISLAGKFCVLMTNTPKQHGISRRIINQEERRRLKNIIATIVANDENNPSSLIIRTAGIDRTQQEIKKDYEYLIKTWDKIRNSVIKTNAPSIIHVEEEIIVKTIRDMLDDKVNQVIIQGREQYEQAIKFVKEILPNEVFKIVEHKSLEPIFAAFNIEEQILSMYQPVVLLPSGGYIVINPTEALTSIDVNSGKSTNEKHIEETALKTNIEACIEIAKQIKLRDLSGIIIVDFIDMHDAKNRKNLEHSFKEALSKDKAKIQLAGISNLGLVEFSRQRLKPSFLEKNSASCSYCAGKGVVRSCEANAILILRTIEKELFNAKLNIINVFAHVDSILYILNKKRKDIERIEYEFSVELNFYQDKTAAAESFYLEKIKLQKPNKEANKASQPTPELKNRSQIIDNQIEKEEEKQQVKKETKESEAVKIPTKDQPRNKRRNFTRKKFVNKESETTQININNPEV